MVREVWEDGEGGIEGDWEEMVGQTEVAYREVTKEGLVEGIGIRGGFWRLLGVRGRLLRGRRRNVRKLCTPLCRLIIVDMVKYY